MKSGLEDRNNVGGDEHRYRCVDGVSMKSGLEDRNNRRSPALPGPNPGVSMKSGLEDRNNLSGTHSMWSASCFRLNEVRPGRPEQFACLREPILPLWVSMKSGLEDRNNTATRQQPCRRRFLVSMKSGLEDRNNHIKLMADCFASKDVSMKSGLEDRNNSSTGASSFTCAVSLNEVRPGRPEQCEPVQDLGERFKVSMKSGLEDRNNSEN